MKTHLLTFVLFGSTIFSSPAATRVWSGSANSGNWNSLDNWGGAGIPQDGDDLVFPAGVAAFRLNSTNNLTGRRVNTITFSGTGGGYRLRGNPIFLANGIQAQQFSGTNSIDLAFTFNTSQTFEVVNASSLLVLRGNISLIDHSLTTRRCD